MICLSQNLEFFLNSWLGTVEVGKRTMLSIVQMVEEWHLDEVFFWQKLGA